MNIVVCQFHTNNLSYSKFSEEINRDYCSHNNYEYYIESNSDKIYDLLKGRPATWYKPILIKETMEKYPFSDYIVFLDMDAVFVNKNRRIEEFITNDFLILVTQDHGPSTLQAGVIIVKNNKVVYDWMDKWWDVASIHSQYIHGLWHDQTCLGLFRDGLDNKEHIKIIENTDLNSRIYSEKCYVFHAFSYGDKPYRTIDKVYNKIFNIAPKEKESLSSIAKRYPTDKDFTHNYFDLVYEDYFYKLYKDVKKFCEIGIGGFWKEVGWESGNSLKIWNEYFPEADILGLDINTYGLENTGRIHIDWIDQSKDDVVKEYSKKLTDYDIILDDASHNMHDQQVSFAYFFRSLKKGGIYIIENLYSSIEVEIPEKRDIWGWGDPTKTTTLDMLENYIANKKIESDYMSDEEKEYLNDSIESVKIHKISPTSITSIIIKK